MEIFKKDDLKMAKIKPFKAYRYNSEKIDNLGSVMAPPYDFISKHNDISYFDMNPYNAIRLVSSWTDEDGENPYERASKFLEDMIQNNVIEEDKNDAVYLYEQRVIINNEPFYSRGFVALLELLDYEKGVVVPCEKPSTNSKQDRYNMVKAVQGNGSLISFKYIDNGKNLSQIISATVEKEPVMDFETTDGTGNRVWIIDNPSDIEIIVSEFKNKLIYVVDGHNRYEAYCEYKRYMKENDPDYSPDKPYNYTMALLTESRDDGMVQQPVHRLIKFPKGFNEDYIVAGAQENFKVEKIIVDPNDESISETMKKQIATQRKEVKIAMYTGGDFFYRFTLKNFDVMNEILPDASEIYKTLDLVVLNKLVLEDLCNIKEDNSDERVFYTTGIEEGMRAISQAEYGCMFVVNPVRKLQMTNITLSGELLPKRSLCVCPKPATGVLIYKF